METLIALLEFYNTYDHEDIFFEVAKYLLFHIDELKEQTVEKLAANIPVSVSTLNRFIKAMAFKDFASVRHLSSSISNTYEYEGKYFPNYFTKREDSFSTYGQMLSQKIIQVTESIKKQNVEELVKAMLKADEIIFVGTPLPYGVWRLQVDLILLKKHTSAFLDPNYQLEKVKSVSPNSVVIGINTLRPSDDYLKECFSIAKNRGAKIGFIANVIGGEAMGKVDYPFVFQGTHTELDTHLIHVILSLIGIVLNEALEQNWKESIMGLKVKEASPN